MTKLQPEDTQTVYDRNAEEYDRQRSRTLFEARWLTRFGDSLPKGGRVLDLGCGAGQPIAAWLIAEGFHYTGVDFSTAMLDIARGRWPKQDWRQADMRSLDLGETFDGIIAWNSFFHLTPEDQRIALQRISDHLHEGAVFMVTVGPQAGEVSGHVDGAEVYHASLSPEDYVETCEKTGLEVVDFTPEDPECDFQTVMTALKK